MPKVSIIIPVWGKYKKYLNECLDNIKQQTFKDYEIIVVDNKRDLPSARNEGIKKAKGEYILPLDVDDLLDPDYLKKTVGVGDIVTTYHILNDKKTILTNNVTLDEMKRHNIVIACSLFKRKVWQDVGGYDENLKTGLEDWDFWLRAMLYGYNIKIVKDFLYYYRKNEDGLISTIPNREEAIRYIINKNVKYSVIIPTMWASDKIKKMIKVYDKSPFVSEVLIINNKPEDEIKLKSKKIKEIYRGKNIYVNPAWNLGVEQVKEDRVIIANDDIYFNRLDDVLNSLWLKDNMVVGPAESCYKIKKDKDIEIAPTHRMGWGFGTFMIMTKKSYSVVPKEKLIFEGDVIQFRNNESFNFKGVYIDTEMSETINKFDLLELAQKDVKGDLSKIKMGFTGPSMDACYLVDTRTKDYNPLKYSVRSISKNLKFDKLFIVGEKPEFLNDDVLEIKVKDKRRNKFLNITEKLWAIINNDRVSEDFIVLNDDFFINEPVNEVPYYHINLEEEVMSDHLRKIVNKFPNQWIFTPHFPIVYNKTLLKELLLNKNIKGECIRTHYCNYYQVESQEVVDKKAYSLRQLEEFLDEPWFSTCDSVEKNKRFTKVLDKSYPRPSKYERKTFKNGTVVAINLEDLEFLGEYERVIVGLKDEEDADKLFDKGLIDGYFIYNGNFNKQSIIDSLKKSYGGEVFFYGG